MDGFWKMINEQDRSEAVPEGVVLLMKNLSTSTSTSQASTSTFSTSKASKTLSVLSDYFDTTIQEVEAEDNITVRPLTSTSEEVEEDLELEEDEEFVAEVAIENSSDFSGDSEGQYEYSDYSTYGFDYSDYLDDYREGSSQQNAAVKTFTVLQESAIGECDAAQLVRNLFHTDKQKQVYSFSLGAHGALRQNTSIPFDLIACETGGPVQRTR